MIPNSKIMQLHSYEVWTNPCIKYARIRVFADPYFHIKGENRRFCPYMRKYASEKTRILAFLADVLQYSCSEKLCKIYRKSTLPESYTFAYMPNTIVFGKPLQVFTSKAALLWAGYSLRFPSLLMIFELLSVSCRERSRYYEK